MTRRLGKGFAEIVEHSTQAGVSLLMIPVNQIKPGRYQPRQEIDEDALNELKVSIKDRGIIQPIIVRPISHGVYELVAGERRWRAAQDIGMQEVPAIVRALGDQETLEYSLIENLQRHNLNPIEEAMGYERLMNEFGYSQEQLSERLGKDRTTITNLLRLLKLPEEIRAAVRDGRISQGHAKVLLGVEPADRQQQLFQEVMRQALSVRQLEQLSGTWQPKARRDKTIDPNVKLLEDALRNRLGTKVMLSSRRRGGRIVIEYFSAEDLMRLLDVLGIQSTTA